MLFARVAETSHAVAATRSRLEKIDRLAEFLRALAPGEIETAAGYLVGALRQGRIGLGPSLVREALAAPAAEAPALTVGEVDAAFERIAAVSGKGSGAERRRLLRDLFSRATHAEQDFLARLILGELRQGALEGVLVDAIARAAGLPVRDVRRAVMLAGNPTTVAAAALTEGAAGLDAFRLALLEPVQPMLARTAESICAALEAFGTAAFEYKLDGARIQVHKEDSEIRMFTRGLNEVSARLPEVAELVRSLPARSIVLDGEAIALRSDGTPHPFQVTMRRFGRKLAVDELRDTLPLSAFFFDCLHLDGEELIDRPAAERFEALSRIVPARARIRRLVTADAAAAGAFLEEALAAGHEGLMAKSLDSVYEAGNRGAGWLKIKPALTLDLVVIAAEWGSGRRRGWLSNLHLAARDPHTNGFVMLGKTFKGMTDAMLAWQTGRLLELETGREGHVVHVRPELVVEIAFNELQASTQYPGGMALRFARVKRYREDKRPADADTIDTVRQIFARHHVTRGAGPPPG
ncbi:MAG TPA: ATP-dependent DNA ligase [Woeseiaceae bacterium]|nr:ATP-dependent DNA ligase [Woeseiaceae bacterium]